MTEYELDKLCERNLDCDCKCIKCPLFAKYVESNNKSNMRLGSHNSMSYLRPSQWWLRPFAWIGRCQSQTIGEQFIVWGVRWFDLRLAFDKKGQPYFAHGIFSYKDKDPFAILD